MTSLSPTEKLRSIAGACLAPCLAALLTAFLVTGCASVYETEPQKLIPAPLPYGVEIKGYTVEGATSTVENDLLMISLTVTDENFPSMPPFFTAMIQNHFLIFAFTIENRSEKPIRFMPNFVDIQGNDGFYYSTPLGYTELYDIAAGAGKKNTENMLAAERMLMRLKGSYYDTPLRIKPGTKATRFLIFKPPANNTTLAILSVKQMYVGDLSASAMFSFTTEKAIKRKKQNLNTYED